MAVSQTLDLPHARYLSSAENGNFVMDQPQHATCLIEVMIPMSQKDVTHCLRNIFVVHLLYYYAIN